DGSLGAGGSISRTLSLGTHTITAAVTDVNGNAGQAQIIVRMRGPNVAPALAITAPQDNSSAPADRDVILTAAANDDFDGDLSSTIRWTSDRDGVLASGASFATNMLSEGTHHITVTATDSGGLMGSAGITLNVIRVPAVTILLPQVNDGFLSGNAVTFYATATDRIDGDVAASLVWTSDLDGQLGTGTTFTTSSLSVGTHTITAKATNSAHN